MHIAMARSRNHKAVLTAVVPQHNSIAVGQATMWPRLIPDDMPDPAVRHAPTDTSRAVLMLRWAWTPNTSVAEHTASRIHPSLTNEISPFGVRQ